MSRGTAFTNPKEFKQAADLVLYDNEGYLWLFGKSDIKKVYVEDLFSLTQQYIDKNMDKLSSTVMSRSATYKSGVLVGDNFYVTPDEVFESIFVINKVNLSVTEIKTPAKMNSNIHFEGSKLWMVTDEVKDQESDQHKMYTYDLTSKAWTSSTIQTKKQMDPFRIWSAGTSYVYTSNWTNFNCSYFNIDTGAYVGSFELNGYPGAGADNGDNTAIVPSYGGMISVVNCTNNAVQHSYNSVLPCNSAGSHIKHVNGTHIWFQTGAGFGFIKKSGKEVHINAAGAAEAELPTDADNIILMAIDNNTVDVNYSKMDKYSLSNANFTDLIVIPAYNILNQEGSFTIKEKVVLVGDVITVFDPDLLKFVFDKPEVIDSGVFCSGKGMITTGDTGYIGEFA